MSYLEEIKQIYANLSNQKYPLGSEERRIANMRLTNAIPYMIGQLEVYERVLGSHALVLKEPEIEEVQQEEGLPEMSGFIHFTDHKGEVHDMTGMNWKPIETWHKPKTEAFAMVYAKFTDDSEDEKPIVQEAMWDGDRQMWKCLFLGAEQPEIIPTHWMPLPPKPGVREPKTIRITPDQIWRNNGE